ncbi:MAG: hypothetical protein QM724_00840 [Flavobacteriales bacterium]
MPTEMVNGSDTGVVHAFRVTNDLFAQGDPRLVNFKTYYFMAIAYAHNEWMKYSPASGTSSAAGQPFPYKAGRKAAAGSIRVYSGIPHKPAPEEGGTVANTAFGDEFSITRLEGQGNGGRPLVIDRFTEDAIMVGPPWRTDELRYTTGRGPVAVKVIDPLRVPNTAFELWFRDTIAPYPSPTQFTSYKNINDGYWMLVRLDGSPSRDDTVYSNSAVGVRYEQLITQWGISVTVQQSEYTGALGSRSDMLASEFLTDQNASANAWYAGIPDTGR